MIRPALAWLAARLARFADRPGPPQLRNELATLQGIEQDARSTADRNWIRGARCALVWASGEPGAGRPSEVLRLAGLPQNGVDPP